MAHDVEVPDAFGKAGLLRQLQGRSGEQLGVAAGNALAALGPFIQMFEFDTEHGALNAFHAIIVADFIMVVADGGAVFAQGTGAGGEVGVVGDEGAAFAKGSEVFAGVKAEAGDFAEGADGTAFVFGAMGLGGIFDEGEFVMAADFADGIEVEGLAIEVHGHDGFGARGDGFFDEFGVEVEGGVVDIDVNGPGADVGNGPTGGDKGEGGADDFVADADV